MNPLLKKILSDPDWVRENEPKIKELLPETWTLMTNLDPLKIGFGFKLLGIDWHNEDEFGWVMVYLEKTGILQRKDYLVRANPDRIFS